MLPITYLKLHALVVVAEARSMIQHPVQDCGLIVCIKFSPENCCKEREKRDES